MPSSVLQNLNNLISGIPITSPHEALRDVLYQRPAPPAKTPAQNNHKGPERYKYYNDSFQFVYKYFSE